MRSAIALLAVVVFLVLSFSVGHLSVEKHAMADQPATSDASKMLAHMVYFALNEPTDENKRKVLDGCQKYLTGHPGTVFYAAGTCATEYDRPVNDRDFDVALQLVFKDRGAQDAYQVSERHKQFVDECKPLWKKVRVFDSEVSGAVAQ